MLVANIVYIVYYLYLFIFSVEYNVVTNCGCYLTDDIGIGGIVDC